MSSRTRKQVVTNEAFHQCQAFGKMGYEPYEFKDGNTRLLSCPNEYVEGNPREHTFKECWQKFIEDRKSVG